MDLDPVRLKVLKLIDRNGTDLKNASLAIGRNAAYLHQFVYRGTPKVLSEDDRAALAEHLGCAEEELRHTTRPPRKPRATSELRPVRAAGAGALPSDGPVSSRGFRPKRLTASSLAADGGHPTAAAPPLRERRRDRAGWCPARGRAP